jgi:hypothetical protein
MVKTMEIGFAMGKELYIECTTIVIFRTKLICLLWCIPVAIFIVHADYGEV